MSAKRTNDDISTALLLALPSAVEVAAMTEDQLKGLRAISNMLDNIAYLELKRREAGELSG